MSPLPLAKNSETINDYKDNFEEKYKEYVDEISLSESYFFPPNLESLNQYNQFFDIALNQFHKFVLSFSENERNSIDFKELFIQKFMKLETRFIHRNPLASSMISLDHIVDPAFLDLLKTHNKFYNLFDLFQEEQSYSDNEKYTRIFNFIKDFTSDSIEKTLFYLNALLDKNNHNNLLSSANQFYVSHQQPELKPVHSSHEYFSSLYNFFISAPMPHMNQLIYENTLNTLIMAKITEQNINRTKTFPVNFLAPAIGENLYFDNHNYDKFLSHTDHSYLHFISKQLFSLLNIHVLISPQQLEKSVSYFNQNLCIQFNKILNINEDNLLIPAKQQLFTIISEKIHALEHHLDKTSCQISYENRPQIINLALENYKYSARNLIGSEKLLITINPKTNITFDIEGFFHQFSDHIKETLRFLNTQPNLKSTNYTFHFNTLEQNLNNLLHEYSLRDELDNKNSSQNFATQHNLSPVKRSKI